MQSRDFCFWLQGFFELNDDARTINAEKAEIIRRHLDLVFAHEIEPMALERPAHDEPKRPVPQPAPKDPEPERERPQENSPPRVTQPPRC